MRRLIGGLTSVVALGALGACTGPSGAPFAVSPAPVPPLARPTDPIRSGQPTRTVVYDPEVGGKPAPGVTVTATTTGHCDGSLAIQRSDAYRCFFDEAIGDGNFADPCFGNGHVGGVAYCVDDLRSGTVVAVRAGPDPNALPGIDPFDQDPTSPTANDPWEIEVGTGVLCHTITGATIVVAGKRESYACTDASSLFGEPERRSPTWTIYRAPAGQHSSIPVTIATAWF